jgi:hypothetical protein
MAATTPLSKPLRAFCRSGEAGIKLFPTTLEDAQTVTGDAPFNFSDRSSAVSAVVEAGVSILDIAGKCAAFWGEDPGGSFAADLAKAIVARSGSTGRLRPAPTEPGPYTLVEWYAGARVVLPIDFSDDRTVTILPQKATISMLAAADTAGLPSLLRQKSTPRPPLPPSSTVDDLPLLAARNATDANDLAGRVLPGWPPGATETALRFFDVALNGDLVHLGMRPDGFALIQRLKAALGVAPAPAAAPADWRSPEARMQRAWRMIKTVEDIAGENAPEVWDAAYGAKLTRIRLPYDAYKKLIEGLDKSFAAKKAGDKHAPAVLLPASEWGGTPRRPVAVELEQLSAILNPRKDTALDAQLAGYVEHVSRAFQVMQIDTLEAQAVYLAHAGGETGGLAQLVEYGQDNSAWAPFVGRGPVQVTWDYNYLQTLAYLEIQADRLHARAKEARTGGDMDEARRLADDAAYARSAVADIKRDFTIAGHPDRAFLFSAAYMHMTHGVCSGPRSSRGATRSSRATAAKMAGCPGRMSPGQNNVLTCSRRVAMFRTLTRSSSMPR